MGAVDAAAASSKLKTSSPALADKLRPFFRMSAVLTTVLLAGAVAQFYYGSLNSDFSEPYFGGQNAPDVSYLQILADTGACVLVFTLSISLLLFCWSAS